VRKYRNDYFALSPLAPELLVIPPGTVEVVSARILQEFEKRLSRANTGSNSLPNAPPERVSA
jgi:hypothetical protein